MDKRNRGAIEFRDFFEVYKEESGIFFWFEFFNQDSLNFTPKNKSNPSLFELFAPSCLLSFVKGASSDSSSDLERELSQMKRLIEGRREERREEEERRRVERQREEERRSEEVKRREREGGWRKEERVRKDEGRKDEGRNEGREEGWILGKVEGVNLIKGPNIGSSQLLSKKGEEEFDNPTYFEGTEGGIGREEGRGAEGEKEEGFLSDLERRLLNMENKVNEMGGAKKDEGFGGKKMSKNQIGTRRSTVRNMPRKSLKEKDAKKNMGIYFGHENWNLVLNMMIGIRTSVKSIYDIDEVIAFLV